MRKKPSVTIGLLGGPSSLNLTGPLPATRCCAMRSSRRGTTAVRSRSCMSPIPLSWRNVSSPSTNAWEMIAMISTIRAIATISSTRVKPCRRRMGVSQSGEDKYLWGTFPTCQFSRHVGNVPPRLRELKRSQIEHLDDIVQDDHGARRPVGLQRRLQLQSHAGGAGLV